MYTQKRHAGSSFPAIDLATFKGESKTLGQPLGEADWHMVVVYRGRHCPMCTKYLNKLAEMHQDFLNAGISIIAVSGDSEQQVEQHMAELKVDFPVAYGLSVEQMQSLGLYISHPRSEQETDHPFAEPGLFVINSDGDIQVVDLSNNPFVRPELKTLLGGLKWIRDPENNYPIRGTYQ